MSYEAKRCIGHAYCLVCSWSSTCRRSLAKAVTQANSTSIPFLLCIQLPSTTFLNGVRSVKAEELSDPTLRPPLSRYIV